MFRASTSPQQLSAVFTSSAANITGSSTTAAVTVGRGNTSTSLDVSNPTVDTGATAAFTARVLPSNVGQVDLSGSVEFIDAGHPIPACAHQPLTVGPASSTATCSVRYARAGTHSITALYSGDSNFKTSSSGPQPVSVHALPPRVLGTIKATMQWTFSSTLTYTTIRLLVVHQAPIGATITATCRGRGCPYTKRVNNVRRTTACKPTPAHRCPTPRTAIVNLQPGFQNRNLRVATQVIVRITRPGWIGKYYLFTIRAGRAPSVRIDCLAPGGSRPGRGC
jgi:hypothetical protein